MRPRCVTGHASGRATRSIPTALLIALLVVLPAAAHAVTPVAPQGKTGLIVPLYSYLGPTWSAIIQGHEEFPNVPLVAIVDPNNGPGGFFDPNFLAGVQALQHAGITVLGYSTTGYGDKNLSAVEATASRYWDWYHVDGMVYDQMPNWDYNSPNGTWYYHGANGTYLPQYFTNLTSFDRSLGMNLTVGNPGTDVPSSFIGSVDMIVIYESPGVPSLSFLGGWHTGYPKSEFAVIAYGVGPYNATYVRDASSFLGYIFLTDGQYVGDLPSYLNPMLATLSSEDAS